MYSVYIKAPREDPNSVLIYDDLNTDEEVLLIDPKLVKEDNASGSFDFEVPLKNVGYSQITPFSKDMDVYIYKQGYENTYGNEGTDSVYWAGRVVDVSRGIDNHKAVYCEGALAFLNDSIQPPNVYETTTEINTTEEKSLRTYLYHLLDVVHNSQVEDNRKIFLGLTTATYEPTKWYTNFESTMEVLEDIASATDGHLRLRRSTREIDGVTKSVWVLDLLNDDIWGVDDTDPDHKWRFRWVPNYDQQIEYGINLSDINQTQTLSNVVTAVYPLGKRKDTSSIEDLDEYTTIDGCNMNKIPSSIRAYVSIQTDSRGYKYILSTFSQVVGRIATSVHYDDVDDPTELMLLGILNLTLPTNVSYEVEASAIDASYRDHSLKQIDTYDVIDVVALPLDKFNESEYGKFTAWMKVSKSEIPLDHPSDTVFTIGSTKIETFTSLSNRRNKAINSELKYLTVKPFEPPEPEPTPET